MYTARSIHNMFSHCALRLNGAGKTTTIRMLTGMSRPSGGQGLVMDMDIATRTRDVKRIAGVVPERSNLYDELTCLDNLAFMGRLYGVSDPARRVRELLDLFSLAGRAEARFAHLSRGMKRRLTLAAALVHRPQVLFLDEPTTGLDVMSARDLRRLVLRLGGEGTTVFLTTHNIEEAGALCSRIAIIVSGHVAAVDTPANLQARAGREAVLDITIEPRPEPVTIPTHPSIESVDARESTITVRVRDMGSALAHVALTLEKGGVTILDVASRKPTLEEAFVQLTGVSQLEMSSGGKGAASNG